MRRFLLAAAVVCGSALLFSSDAYAQRPTTYSGYVQSRHGGYHQSYRPAGISVRFGNGYGGYYGGHRGGYHGGHHRGHYDWHDTSHYDYHPGGFQRHGNHYHYVPGHYDYHRQGHWDYHH